jgi:hypothetical protein
MSNRLFKWIQLILVGTQRFSEPNFQSQCIHSSTDKDGLSEPAQFSPTINSQNIFLSLDLGFCMLQGCMGIFQVSLSIHCGSKISETINNGVLNIFNMLLEDIP